uniref:Sorting nexin-3 n=1 Tax=Meloidogyne incognita TaxID=6306 RepID=A0A914MIQ0_MELIC
MVDMQIVNHTTFTVRTHFLVRQHPQLQGINFGSDYIVGALHQPLESSVRRRYSDFEWLRNELERDSKIIVPLLPGKALKRQLPFRNDDGIFDETFIEERRKGLEQFLNKVAGHPLAQNEKSLHIFLQMTELDKNYIPGRIRTA